MLKANDSVVRVAHDNQVASGASLPPLVDPLIIDMMEVDVCQERTDDRALRRPPPPSRSHRPSSSTPAVSHLAINRMIRRSPIRCSTKRISQSRLTLSKKD